MRRSASTYFQQWFGRKPGGDVASGDGGGPGDTGPFCRTEDPFHDPFAGLASRVRAADSGTWKTPAAAATTRPRFTG